MSLVSPKEENFKLYKEYAFMIAVIFLSWAVVKQAEIIYNLQREMLQKESNEKAVWKNAYTDLIKILKKD